MAPPSLFGQAPPQSSAKISEGAPPFPLAFLVHFTAVFQRFSRPGTEYLHRKVADDGWGKGTVRELADWLTEQEPDLRGFSASNLWRMRQFYDVYSGAEELAPLVRVLSWTQNLIILGKCKTLEERGFYLRLAIEQRWPKRELERQIEGCLFERALIDPPKLATALRELHRVSRALVAEYQTRLPNGKLLQAKPGEFYSLAQREVEG